MPKSIYFICALLLFIVCCKGPSDSKSLTDSSMQRASDTLRNEIASEAASLTITPDLLKKYEDSCATDTLANEQKFVSNFGKIVRQFSGRKLDTTILTTGNLDGDAVPDTIISRVYYDGENVYVDAKWVKDHHVLWKDRYSNPYISLSANLFNDSSSNTWPYFAVGIVYGPPEFYKRNDRDFGDISSVYKQGLDDLRAAGVHLTKEEYEAWLRGFKGDLLIFGEPESREGLWIWYKPAAKMIIYYHD